jgi:hypothetical protein
MNNANTIIKYSRGKNKFDNCPDQRASNNFDDFEQAVISDLSPKKGLAFICSPLQSGVHYQNPEEYPGDATWRLKNYALPRQFLAFDFDGFSSPEAYMALLEYLRQYRGFGNTTANHTDSAPRARAILLASRPVSREEGIIVCQSIQNQISSQLGAEAILFDVTVYRGEQPIYTPVTTSEMLHFNGTAVDVGAHLRPAQTPERPIKDTGLGAALIGGIDGYVMPERLAEGERNSGVLAHVGHLRGSGVTEDLIAEQAKDFNTARCKPPLDDDEVVNIVSRYEEPPSTPAIDLAPDEWPEPQEIKAALLQVPEFDLDMLPDVFKRYVADASELMQSPPEFIAVPLMIGAAATLGNQWAIAPKAKDTRWKVPPVLWGAIIGRPGTKKSPCINSALVPLLDIETNLADAHTQRLQLYQ